MVQWRCAVLKGPPSGRSLTVCGGFGEGETPLPIPNRAVKPLSADGTWPARARESRSPPLNVTTASRPHGRLVGRCATIRSVFSDVLDAALGALGLWPSIAALIWSSRGPTARATTRTPRAPTSTRTDAGPTTPRLTAARGHRGLRAQRRQADARLRGAPPPGRRSRARRTQGQPVGVLRQQAPAGPCALGESSSRTKARARPATRRTASRHEGAPGGRDHVVGTCVRSVRPRRRTERLYASRTPRIWLYRAKAAANELAASATPSRATTRRRASCVTRPITSVVNSVVVDARREVGRADAARDRLEHALVDRARRRARPRCARRRARSAAPRRRRGSSPSGWRCPCPASAGAVPWGASAIATARRQLVVERQQHRLGAGDRPEHRHHEVATGSRRRGSGPGSPAARRPRRRSARRRSRRSAPAGRRRRDGAPRRRPSPP